MVGSKGLDEAETVTKKLSEKKEMAARLCWRLFQFPDEPTTKWTPGRRESALVCRRCCGFYHIFNVNNGQKRLLLLRPIATTTTTSSCMIISTLET